MGLKNPEAWATELEKRLQKREAILAQSLCDGSHSLFFCPSPLGEVTIPSLAQSFFGGGGLLDSLEEKNVATFRMLNDLWRSSTWVKAMACKACTRSGTQKRSQENLIGRGVSWLRLGEQLLSRWPPLDSEWPRRSWKPP